MADKACNDQNAVQFVRDHLDDSQQLADALKVPVEFVLGLAAHESEWGKGRIARELNNYFSLHAPAPFQVGDAAARGDPKVRVAKFNSFLQCGNSFVEKYKDSVGNAAKAEDFTRKLMDAGFNSGDPKTGGTKDWDVKVGNVIKMVKLRMSCPE